jgi:hypothetical protein
MGSEDDELHGMELVDFLKETVGEYPTTQIPK